MKNKEKQWKIQEKLGKIKKKIEKSETPQEPIKTPRFKKPTRNDRQTSRPKFGWSLWDNRQLEPWGFQKQWKIRKNKEKPFLVEGSACFQRDFPKAFVANKHQQPRKLILKSLLWIDGLCWGFIVLLARLLPWKLPQHLPEATPHKNHILIANEPDLDHPRWSW